MDLKTAKKSELVAAVLEQGLIEHQVEAERLTHTELVAMLSGAMPEPEPAEPAARAVKAPAKGAKRMKLTIYEQEGTEGSDDVAVSVNGVAYQIKRGVEVEVPSEVVHVLENAVTTVFEPLKEGGVRERNVKRFNFSVRV